MKKCKHCFFWRELPQSDCAALNTELPFEMALREAVKATLPTGPIRRFGECRRYPRVWVGDGWQYPPQEEDDGCGEFFKKEVRGRNAAIEKAQDSLL